MFQEPELEEGETCYYKDDTSIDPDVALSYIGDKVQSILGHLQKDFEGGVSAENLGAKFGGYGSFLPTHQRSPSIWSQPKSPHRVHNPNSPRSPNACPEGPALNLPSQTLKTPSNDASIGRKAIVSSDKVAEVVLPPSKLGNQPDQRSLKLRIKVGPERVAQYNAEIYNLGLTSPSSSEGNSGDESDGLLIESHETPNESPGSILKIMTSFPVPGGLLLSPLCEDLLNLAKETENPVESKFKAATKSSASSVRLSNNNVILGKKTKIADKSGNMEKPEDEVIVNHNDRKHKAPGVENIVHPFHELSSKPLPDSVQETDKAVQVKRRKGNNNDRVKERAVSGDSVKDTFLEHTFDQSSSVEKFGEQHKARISQKDASVDHGQGTKNRGEGVIKRTVDNSSLKVGVNRLSVEGEKRPQGVLSSGKLALRPDDKDSGKKGVRKIHLTKREHVGTPKNLLETPKSSNLDPVKAKSANADKMKERLSSSKKGFERVSYDALLAEPPAAASIPAKEGIVNGLKQPVAALPEVIEENWVACDRCEKWRLLPYGTKSEDLPDKWVCSMLDWLPGMNRCEISEDETTAALHASYAVPAPQNQHNFQAHADAAMPGVMSSNTHHFNQNLRNCASDQMKRPKLKEKRNPVSSRDSVPSNGKMQLQRPAARNESVKVVKQSLSGVNATDNPDMQHPNKSTFVSEKPNKRKSEHVVGDEANMRKKIKRESGQHVNGEVKRIKSKDALTVDNFQTSDGKKMSVQRNTVSGGDLRITLKQHTGQTQDVPGNGPFGIKACNGNEVASHKIRLKNFEYSPQINEKAPIKEDSKGGDFQRDTKPRLSQADTSKRKSSEARFQSSGSKENPVNRTIEKEQKVRKPKTKVKLTVEDIDKLRQDLGCEQPSTAATSSSSKVSGSRKNRVSYLKVKGSPDESVSSSPVRMPDETVGKVDSRFNNVPTIGNAKGISGLTNDNGSEIFDSRSKLKEETGFENRSAKSVKKGTSIGKKDFGKPEHDKSADVMQQNLCRESPKCTTEPWSGKVHIDLRQVDKQGASCRKKQASGLSRSTKRSSTDSRPLDTSTVDNSSKALKETAFACPQNVTDNIDNNEAEQSMAIETSLGIKNVSTALKEAEVALREAEELRIHADLIKNSGFSSESNYEYFKAALKFLHGASLLETCNGESSKPLEMSPMQMYGAAAQLCKTCASEYEKSHEMAAAALTYKCMEVAYLRVVYCKSSNTSRVWNDLQSSLQMAPQGESPSSSASDVDNLNNLVMTDKATLSKGGGGGSHAGTHAVVPRNRLNFARLLDFTKDVNAAMEAAKKSQDSFAAARVELEQSQNKEAIVSVKRVIDFSFQDVEELVRLVSLAFNTVNHQGLSGNRE
ncbi:hypothetical protein PHJA_000338000 [Phtheirospermum japonicum]|uniref:CW-type domain-containing protein n=1 Tax=Phtheirospermum japonicum TaxID=374723 RepID=A0A830B4B7_9LAMI|nr:hypothetical protein PHJA_000338000 [Phtheirospermum japonicum]